MNTQFLPKTKPGYKITVDHKWLAEHKEEIIDDMYNDPWTTEVENYFPEDFGKDIGDGAWVLVLHPPCTELKIKKFSIWFAVPSEPSMHHHKYPIFVKLVSLMTEFGELRLFPREYSVIDIKTYLPNLTIRDGNTEPDMQIRYLTSAPTLTENMCDMVFYLQTRGISLGTAYMMLLDKIKDPNFCYFEMHQVYIDAYTR